MIVHSCCLPQCCGAASLSEIPMPIPRSLRSSLAVAFAAALLAACSGGSPDPDKSAAPPPPPEVGVVTLEARTVTLSRELTGRTSPYVVAEVRPQVTGIVEERLFTEGGPVKQGQVLYKLDDA